MGLACGTAVPIRRIRTVTNVRPKTIPSRCKSVSLCVYMKILTQPKGTYVHVYTHKETGREGRGEGG